jgi:hypothetical protein
MRHILSGRESAAQAFANAPYLRPKGGAPVPAFARIMAVIFGPPGGRAVA